MVNFQSFFIFNHFCHFPSHRFSVNLLSLLSFLIIMSQSLFFYNQATRAQDQYFYLVSYQYDFIVNLLNHIIFQSICFCNFRDLWWFLSPFRIYNIFRLLWVIANNCYAIPAYFGWLVVFSPILLVSPGTFWHMEDVLFSWLLSSVACWNYTAGKTTNFE